MFKKVRLFALTAVISGFHVSYAHSTTIQDSVSQAISAHPSVSAALAGKVIAQEEYNEVWSDYLPQLSLGATGGRVYANNSTSRGLTVDRGAGYSWLGEGSAALNQNIFNGMETSRRLNAAKARQESADFTILDRKEAIALRAVQSHIGVHQAHMLVQKIDAQLRDVQSYADRIKLLVDEGASDMSELSQAQNVLLLLKENKANFQGQLKSALAQYREVIGHYPKDKLSPPPVLHEHINKNVDAVLATVPNHPTLVAGQKSLDAAGYDIKVEQSGYFPTLDGELSYLKRDQREVIGGESEDGRAVLNMGWDFALGGAQKSRVKRARAQYSEIMAQNKEVARQIAAQVRRSYVEFETAEKQYLLVKERQKMTEDILNTYETQFDGGQIKLIQLMQADNELFNVELEALNAAYRSLYAQYAIVASAGTLQHTLEKAR